MKSKLYLLFAVLSAVFFLSACGQKVPTLYIYCWGDYISADVIAKFEQENNCRVRVDEFDSNENMYAKLKAGAKGYDIVVPSSYFAKSMYDQGMLEDLDKSKLPNVQKNYDRRFESLSLDPEQRYSVPYFVSITGIGYNSNVLNLSEAEKSWRVFERKDLKGRITMLNDMREALGAALRCLGYDINTVNQTEIDEATALVIKWKANIAKFGVDDVKNSLATKEFFLIHAYNGDMLQISFDCPEVKFFIPKEGTTVCFDEFAILKMSQQKDLAYKFIDFMYDSENAAKNMNEIRYTMPHREAVNRVDADLRNNPIFNISDDDLKRLIPLKALGADTEKYSKAWDRIQNE